MYMILCSFYRYVIYLFSRIVTQCIEILFCVFENKKRQWLTAKHHCVPLIDTHRGETVSVQQAFLLDIILLFMKSCTLVRSRINVAIVKSALLEHAILKITRECTLAKKHLNAGIVKRALL